MKLFRYFNNKKFIYHIVFLILTLFSVGCLDKNLKLELLTTKKLNLDEQHNSLPVVIRVYQLKKEKKFLAAEFYNIWKQDQKTLQDDLLKVEEFNLSPDKSYKLVFDELNPKAEYLAIVGLFRKPHGKNWKAIVPLKNKRTVKLKVENDSIIIAN